MNREVSERDLFIEKIKNIIYNNDICKALEFEEEVINRNIVELSYWYAHKVKNVDISRHEDVVYNGKDLVWVFSFAKNVEGANVGRLSSVIIESGDAYYNYLAACQIPNTDKLKHGMMVFLSKDPEYNYLFAKNVEGADIKLHEKAVALSGNERFINKFMRDIPGADLNMLSKAVIKGENPFWNYVVARDYGVNILEHGYVVFKTLDPEYNYLFAKNIEGSDIKLHAKAVLLSKNKEFIIMFNNLLKEIDDVKKLVKEKQIIN